MSPPTPGPVYKIVHREAWRAAADPWPGSADDLRDGYVHLSTAAQVPRTLAKWFEPGRDDLLVLTVDPDALPVPLRWEGKPGGDTYPHLYAGLPRAAVTHTHTLVWTGSAYDWPSASA